MVKFIELKNAVYRNGAYSSEPLIVNSSEIIAVSVDRSGKVVFSVVRTRAGSFKVFDSCDEIMKKLRRGRKTDV